MTQNSYLKGLHKKAFLCLWRGSLQENRPAYDVIRYLERQAKRSEEVKQMQCNLPNLSH